jgi:hypothetical protein
LLEVVRTRESWLAPTNIHLLQAQEFLAQSYYNYGEHYKALSIIQKVVDRGTTVWKPGNPHQDFSENLLAQCISAIEEEKVVKIGLKVNIEGLYNESGVLGYLPP